jgi:hypothetical protein
VKSHPHCEIIKAWADGAEIQWYHEYEQRWYDHIDPPSWSSAQRYRIKPKVEYKLYLYTTSTGEKAVCAFNKAHNSLLDVENTINFLYWITPEWIEYKDKYEC